MTPARRQAPLLTLAAFLAGLGFGCGDSDKIGSTSANEAVPAESGPLHARIETARGNIRFKLRPDAAPISCANFVNLVDRGFYDGLKFHRHSRVIRQTGNPYNDDEMRWSPGYTLLPEFSPDLRFDVGGRVAMVRVNQDPASPVRPTEFFLTTKPQSERFTFVYPIFGEVVEGQDVVDAIQIDDVMDRIVIEGDPRALIERHRDLVDSWNRQLDRSEFTKRP